MLNIMLYPYGSDAAPPLNIKIEAAPGAALMVIEALRKAGHEVESSDEQRAKDEYESIRRALRRDGHNL